ncbi:MAG: adenylate/guanylate cyclase domain-containing protein, partial [Bacteroidota bacterium]
MKHLVPNFIQTQYQNGRTTGAFQAYTMFIDLSGFTPLTETLMRQGNEGAEQLSRSLNNIFSPMVHLVYQRKGFIPYFAGDAFTAIFPLDQPDFDEQTLIETARQLRDMFTIEGLKKTRFGFFQIGIKIGLSKGEVQWGIIGDQYKSFYFRGDAIDNCAKSEHMASGQEIILEQHLVKGLAEAELPQMEPLEDGYYRLLENEPLSSEPNNTVVNLAPLEREVAKLFLPLSVLDYSEEGEFRNLVSIFISFRNVKDREQFNTFSTIVLNQINNFSGYFKEVDFGDKGGVMVGFFGAPVSFENNMDRALEFIYSVQQEIIPLQQQGHLQIRAGITVGLAFTGIVGGEERCQYAAVGNRVNLAARLMIHSKWGEVLVDEDIRKCRSFHFEHTGDIRYKGIEGNIPTYRLSGRKEDNEVVYSGQMFGRKEELASLIQYAEPIFEDRFSGLVYVYGEAGIGKSRLSYELRQELRKKGNVQWYSCPADQILRKPFNPFIYFLRNHFGQSPENTTLINHQNFENKWQWLMNDLENA